MKLLPGGRTLYSKLIGAVIPYTGSIDAEMVELRTGFARARLRDRRQVRNHLDSIHAIALANLAELAGNSALAYSLPDRSRFIVSKLVIEYKKKARGDITATCDCPIPSSNQKQEYLVPISLTDDKGDEVASVLLTTLVGPTRD
ncbi:MAG: hypothetical protein RJA70_925 [Pseudomonadota bacterium]|jgi:acyl-coenzyme A thioesterase PaaI-like protein